MPLYLSAILAETLYPWSCYIQHSLCSLWNRREPQFFFSRCHSHTLDNILWLGRTFFSEWISRQDLKCILVIHNFILIINIFVVDHSAIYPNTRTNKFDPLGSVKTIPSTLHIWASFSGLPSLLHSHVRTTHTTPEYTHISTTTLNFQPTSKTWMKIASLPSSMKLAGTGDGMGMVRSKLR